MAKRRSLPLVRSLLLRQALRWGAAALVTSSAAHWALAPIPGAPWTGFSPAAEIDPLTWGAAVFATASVITFAAVVAVAIGAAAWIRPLVVLAGGALPSNQVFFVLLGCTVAYALSFLVMRPPNFSLSIVALSGGSLLALLSLRDLARAVWPSKQGVSGAPWIVNLGTLFTAVLTCAMMLELALRIHNPFEFRLRGNQIILPHHKSYLIEDEHNRKLEKRIIHTKNSLGFRGPEPPIPFDRALTILAVGGSTTENFFISDGKDWPSVVAALLKRSAPQIWVNNAGLDGHSTFGHQVLIDDYGTQMRPKIILYLIGINDVGRVATPVVNRNLAGIRTFSDRLSDYSELALVLHNVSRRIEIKLRGLDRNWMQHREVDFASEFGSLVVGEPSPPDLAAHAESLAGYEVRVRALVRRSNEIGGAPVLLTQPMLWGDEIDPETGIDLRHGLPAWVVLEAYNDIVRRIGAETGTLVIDLARRLPKNSALFYDEIHFTSEGAADVGWIVAAELCPMIKRKFAEFTDSGDCPTLPGDRSGMPR